MNRTIRTFAALCVSGTISLLATLAVLAWDPPEIANIVPDYPGVNPHLITGEHFDPAHTEVWGWEPPSNERVVREAAERLGEALPALPEQPPAGSHRVEVLDVETKVITASLEGAVVWTKTTNGFSRPCLFNVAKPFWVSEEKAAPGDLVYIFGFGDPLQANRVAWFHSLTPPTAVVRLQSETRLESLTVEGATWKGGGGYGLVETAPEEITFPVGGHVRNVRIADCRLRGLEAWGAKSGNTWLNWAKE